MRITIPGVLVGHHSDHEARTGCTVLRLPEGAVASGEVRGGAPATREFALLDPSRAVERLDAVVLSGGSAFGLRAAEGVVDRLEAQGIGFATEHGPVPIVVAMALYDLGVGRADVRPEASHGAAAFDAATQRPETGQVGAGTGATTGKWRGGDPQPGGLGMAVTKGAGFEVLAVVAVNAAGDIRDGTAEAEVDAGVFSWPDPPVFAGRAAADNPSPEPGHGSLNTVIGVVVTDAAFDKAACHVLAQGAHDGLARAVSPPHSRRDGDAFVAASTASAQRAVPLDEVRFHAVCAVEQAIRNSVACAIRDRAQGGSGSGERP